MDSRQAIISAGKYMRWMLWAILMLMVLCFLGVPALFDMNIEPLKDSTWLTLGFTLLSSMIEGDMIALELNGMKYAIAMGLFAVISAIMFILVWQIDRLFRQYSMGYVFNRVCSRHVFILGWALIALFVANAIADGLIEYWYQVQDLSWAFKEPLPDDTGQGETFYLMFISLDFPILLAGLFVLAVGRVMTLGNQLQDDVDSTI